MYACESKLASRSSRKATVPRRYLLSRPRSCGRMPSLVGDRGQKLRVLGNLTLVQQYDSQGSSTVAVCALA